MICPKCKAETGKQAGYDRHHYLDTGKALWRLYCQHCKAHSEWDHNPNTRGDGGGGPPIPPSGAHTPAIPRYDPNTGQQIES